MDSGNSGSIQSSSGDEEYDSRAESISAFLNPSSGHVGPMPNPPQPQPQPPPPQPRHHQSQVSSSMFDPLSNYFDPLSRPPPQPQQLLPNPNSSTLLNLDMVWSKTLRSDPNCTDLGGVVSSSSASQHFSGSQGQGRNTFQSSPPAVQFPPAPENAGRGTGSSEQPNMVRNSKKRSRASRRAPTTVLTTDTTNFRAMVQEFTGIPAPPFTSSPFPRTRLDIFGTASTLRSGHLDTTPPPYLLRPFAQKVQQLPFVPSCSTTNSTSSPSSLSSSSFSFPSSSLVDAMASSTSANTNIAPGSSTSNTSNSTAINYQLPSDHLGLLKQPPQTLLNMQSPIFTFQSLLQTPPKYPLPNSAILGSKTQGSMQIPSNDSHLKMGVLDEFGLSHGHVNTQLTGLPSIERNVNNPPSWVDGSVGTSVGDQGLLRALNGNYSNSQRVTNGKLNFSASSSDFHGDKGSENVSTRSEGMVESWICSSD